MLAEVSYLSERLGKCALIWVLDLALASGMCDSGYAVCTEMSVLFQMFFFELV